MVDWPWPDINQDSQLEVYVEVTMEGSVTLRTKRIGQSQMPAWNEELPMYFCSNHTSVLSA
jgi:C2 domain